MPTLDIAKFRKVWALVGHGATEGEQDSARARAEKMAEKAGMTLADAVNAMHAPSPGRPVNIFAGFDDHMEAKFPGYKAEQGKKKAERDARDAGRRAEILKAFGSEDAFFARNEREVALDAAIAPMVTEWGFWTGGDGTQHRVVEAIDGKRPKHGFWSLSNFSTAAREAVTNAYPWPSSLGLALDEAQEWDRLRIDRGLFHGEWHHYPEVECRVGLLEEALEGSQSARSFADIKARFAWKRWEFERQWIDPTERDDPFLDRIEADFEEHDARLRVAIKAAIDAINKLDRDIRQASIDAAVSVLTAAEAAK